jgi:hypothetical protein
LLKTVLATNNNSLRRHSQVWVVVVVVEEVVSTVELAVRVVETVIVVNVEALTVAVAGYKQLHPLDIAA